ncbi:hypothetical protein QWY85_00365 [Neolewinella lacunae]|uniref:Cytochrome c domain-containing protein n=1 Tax=Neolewinella lacunae TaxID=1517758 RepID=A0A923PJP5_9BACT|nr:hypothetical protein [Neolewinella lacunae]MBC6995378.1 hypothetical protein [Neolewinella lacunae]MDN3633090.1 hypothetical protein [Neolewinella lacunae]
MRPIALLSLLFLFTACYYDNEEDLFQYVAQDPASCEVTVVTYSADVGPLLTTYCTRCHRVGRTDGNVNLEGYSRVLPYVNNGALLGTAGRQPGFPAMPPSGGSIPACDLQKLTAWIEAGALNN